MIELSAFRFPYRVALSEKHGHPVEIVLVGGPALDLGAQGLILAHTFGQVHDAVGHNVGAFDLGVTQYTVIGRPVFLVIHPIMVAWNRAIANRFNVRDVAHVKIKVLCRSDTGVKAKMIGFYNLPPVELAVGREETEAEDQVPEGLGIGVGTVQPGCEGSREVPGLGAVGGEGPVVGHGQHALLRGLRMQGQQPRQVVRLRPVVAVDKDDEIAPGCVQPRVPSGGDAAVGLVDHPDPGIPGRPGVAEGRGIVRGAIVDQQELEVPLGLGQHTLDALVQKGLGLKDRDDHADPGPFVFFCHFHAFIPFAGAWI